MRPAGCEQAGLLIDRPNVPAMRLYGPLDGTEAARDQVLFTFPLDAGH